MKKRLKPDLFIDSIYELDLEMLKDKGISNLIIDIDNTVVSWNQTYLDQEIKDYINHIKEQGFDICFISNNTKKRSRVFEKELDIPVICNAAKPMKRCFKKALTILDGERKNTAVIGDQIFTGVYGGNRMKLFTILVKPISEQEFITTKIMRKMENKVLKEIKDRYEK